MNEAEDKRCVAETTNKTERKKDYREVVGASRRWRKHSICESVRSTREEIERQKRKIIARKATALRS